MATRDDLGLLAGEALALQATIAAQPQTTNPVTGETGSSGKLVGGALLVGMRTARSYLEDPLPFWVLGGGLALIVVLVLALAIRGARK